MRLHLETTVRHKTLSRERCGASGSEFEDLIETISELKGKILSCLEKLNLLCSQFMQATPGTREGQIAGARMSKIAANMQRQIQQIGTHYGWVLASDHALVDEVLRSHFVRTVDSRRWLKNAVENFKAAHLLLGDSARRAL
ncbi:hypothetical protein GT037_001945 [Alternaria burnsii]|uniref:Uncharacterized protein n=1 Tax=Alternaria burnsii TaxID=1187904 RepID=A0A8H7B9U6_9PLEO|nr:uncharacterized protein GT037_001945 [Alternaria burnsii]KAF7680294.1 hypothetical protein GT037_001945 [Alternaria burnsii]